MAKTQVKNYVFKPGLGLDDNLFPNAYSLLESNKTFIIKETVAWIQSQIDAGASGFVGYTYNSAKCERDIGYVLDAFLNDLRYGGNEQLRNTVKYYWDQGVSQLDGDRQPEIQSYTFIGTLIDEYVLTNIEYARINTEVAQTFNPSIDAIQAEEAAFTKLAQLVTDTVETITSYSYTITAEPSGVGTIKLGNRYDTEDLLLITNVTKNEIIYNFSNPDTGAVVSLNTSNITADEDYPKFLQNTDAITTITLKYNTSTHSASDQLQILTEKTENGKSITTVRPFDFGTDAIERTRHAAPVSMLDADFEYGLQPTKWAAIGTMRGYPSIYEIPGTDTPVVTVTSDASFGNTTEEFDIEMTNSSTNHYSINSGRDRLGNLIGDDPIITVREGDTINIVVNTPGSNNYRMFFKTTPTHDSTTDLIPGVTGQGAETGQTISWTTSIGDAGSYFYVAQGYTNMEGIIRVTEADPLAGFGQSKITITTVTPHGVSVGEPITVKALEDSVTGASRAEGSFVVSDVEGSNQLSYFAKAKVGSVPGTVIATSYTQLRQAGFYTGATIGDPSFEIVSNGTSGTLSLELGVLQGSTILPFDGISPEVGAPLAGDVAINPDAQVTGVNDTSAGGGEYITVEIDGDYESGDSAIDVVDATGVVANLALDRGDGFATFVSSVDGNTLNLSNALADDFTGNETDYLSVSGSNVLTTGSEVSVNISRTGGAYNITSFTDAGTGYELGDRLIISGTTLGGLTPEHDLEILVNSVVSDGSIDTFTTEGSSFDGVATVSNLTPAANGGNGSGQLFDISFTDNVYSVSVAAGDTSSNFIQNDVIKILGSSIPQGSDPTNDVFVTVTGVDGSGKITSATASGTAPDAVVEYTGVAYSGGSGTGAAFDVTRTGTVYSVSIQSGQQGINYVPTDTITVLGTSLGGTSPTNDVTITVDNVDGAGGITDFSVSGVAVNTGTADGILGDPLIGEQFQLSVSLNAGTYSLDNIDTAGQNYGVGQTFTIPGTQLIGETPTNDLTITIDSIGVNRSITGVSLSGTAAGATATYSDVTPSNLQPVGVGALFNITRDDGAYAISLVSAGNDYKVGNRILIPGTNLGGTSPLNDLELRVTAETAGAIDTFADFYVEATTGNILRLFSTVTISEPTLENLNAGASVNYAELATIEVTFENAHGLVPGDAFIATISSDDGLNNHKIAGGSFIVNDIPELNKLRYSARTEGTISTDAGIDGQIYARPDSFFVHRPFDGGVQLGTGGPQHGAQAIRQSKKYIRYQSGKGIMYTTGALFAPSYDIRSATSDGVEVGSLITITTDDNDHGVQVGGIVRLLGIETPGYNSGPQTSVPPEFDYEVVEVVDERTFKVRSQRRLGSTEAVLGFGAQMSVVAWHGATVRSGIFDDQNGIFWEFDGTQISVVQRTGTQQLAGTIAMTVDNNLVTGTNTRFRDQLKAGDRIVIKGMTHVVSHVNSQTECTVTPDWRGVVNITGTKANLIVDKKVKQSEFNLDKLDGTGPSGYDLDIAKMQMIGIQYSWYGAGFIDFMLRGADGNFVYAHRMRNSNVNTEAFMRSGNLPVRYEVTNEGPPGKLSAAIDNSQTTLPLADSSFFPDAGTVYIDNEIISFTGNNKDTNTLTGCTRGTTYSNYQAGASRTYAAGSAASHDDRTGVILISQTITPLISHWGSAFITDGGFDEDRGYIFSYVEKGITVETENQTAFLIRLAPSVSNALVGDLGERELLNRAQLLLQSLEITSDSSNGSIVVEGILNPRNYPANPSAVSWTELTGVAQGGQPSFAQIAGGGGITWTTSGSTTNNSATVSGAITATFPTYYGEEERNGYVGLHRGDGDWYIPDELFDGSGIERGDEYVSDTGPGSFESGTVVSFIRRSDRTENGVSLTRIAMSRGYDDDTRFIAGKSNGGTDTGDTITLRKIGSRSTYNRTNYLYYTESSYESALAAGVVVGTQVAVTDTSWPAGTRVQFIEEKTFGLVDVGQTTFYLVFYSSTSTGNISASSTTTYNLTPATFAEPGETIFSFIATPGERATVDFSELKELTNTPLGGRGTFPNGPDVLAINVYKTSGNDVNANVILNWGEAQA